MTEMGFFEAPPSVHEPEPEPFRPEWMGPPANVLPAAVPLRLLLARTPDLAVAITDASAFPTGFQLTLSLRLRNGGGAPAFDPLGNQFMGHLGGLQESGGSAELPPELFRFGVQYADGRKATTIGNPFPAGEDVEGPVLRPRSGGGGGHEWDQSYWVWPLPPLGSVTFACEWPAHGVELTQREIHASLILDAAADAQTLWKETSSDDEPRAIQSSSFYGGPSG